MPTVTFKIAVFAECNMNVIIGMRVYLENYGSIISIRITTCNYIIILFTLLSSEDKKEDVISTKSSIGKGSEERDGLIEISLELITDASSNVAR